SLELLDWPHLDAWWWRSRPAGGLGGDEVTAPAEGLVVGRALLGAGAGLSRGQGVHLFLHKIDQAHVLHSRSLEIGWLPTQMVARGAPKSTATVRPCPACRRRHAALGQLRVPLTPESRSRALCHPSVFR